MECCCKISWARVGFFKLESFWCQFYLEYLKVYPEPSQTSEMESFPTKVNDLKSLTIVFNSSGGCSFEIVLLVLWCMYSRKEKQQENSDTKQWCRKFKISFINQYSRRINKCEKYRNWRIFDEMLDKKWLWSNRLYQSIDEVGCFIMSCYVALLVDKSLGSYFSLGP